VKQSERRICDYEGSRYRTEFWGGREYEDLAERIALARLLPPQGRRIIDVGAGFGRLADLYGGYRQVVLLDYSRSMLREARARLGDERFVYLAADLYDIPLADALFDTAVTVRVLHHLEDVPAALREIRRLLRPGGVYVLEYANKRHLKAILRYLLRLQKWNPFSPQPYSFAPLHFDFHPRWMEATLQEAGFAIEKTLAVSHFRHPFLKRCLPPTFLARLDGLLQKPLAPLKTAPSIFVRARARKETETPEAGDLAFRCLRCGHQPLSPRPDGLLCPRCGHLWPLRDGIYDFKG